MPRHHRGAEDGYVNRRRRAGPARRGSCARRHLHPQSSVLRRRLGVHAGRRARLDRGVEHRLAVPEAALPGSEHVRELQVASVLGGVFPRLRSDAGDGWERQPLAFDRGDPGRRPADDVGLRGRADLAGGPRRHPGRTDVGVGGTAGPRRAAAVPRGQLVPRAHGPRTRDRASGSRRAARRRGPRARRRWAR